MLVILVSAYLFIMHVTTLIKKKTFSYFFLVVRLLFSCAFISFICFVFRMSEFDALLASRRSF